MSKQLQYSLIAVSLLVLFMIVRYIRKSRLSTNMAVIWVLWSLGLVLISVFPNIIYGLTSLLGIISPMNSLFLIMVFILYLLVFFLYLKISILENKLNSLAQHIGISEEQKAKKQ